MKAKPYCRELEDKSGFVVVEPIIRRTSLAVFTSREDCPLYYADPKWEKVLGLGSTPRRAWADRRKRNYA